MSYRSYNSIQPIDSYESAVRYINLTAPIRGTKRIPLGERRYHHSFDIRKQGENIVACLSDIPIVTYRPDGTIELVSGMEPSGRVMRWGHVTEAYFIRNLLWNYIADADMHKRALRLTFKGGEKVALTVGVPLIVKPEGGALTIVSEAVMQGWRLNRKATNAIRKQYGEFYRYVKAMVSLRTEELYERTYHNVHKTKVIDIPLSEMDLVVVPIHPKTGEMYAPQRSKFLLFKPPMGVTEENDWSGGEVKKVTRNRHAEWVANMERLLTFVRGEGEKHESFHMGFLLVAYSCGVGATVGGEKYIRCVPTDFSKTLDRLLFQWHSKEVFELVTFKQGQVPNWNYTQWLDREHS
jgi:hypothetical protein